MSPIPVFGDPQVDGSESDEGDEEMLDGLTEEFKEDEKDGREGEEVSELSFSARYPGINLGYS